MECEPLVARPRAVTLLLGSASGASSLTEQSVVDADPPAQQRAAPRAKLSLLILGGAAFAGSFAARSRSSATGAAQDLEVTSRAAETYDADMDTCWQYDDDSSYYVSADYCGPFDADKYCVPNTTAVSDTFYSLCSASCSDGNTWAMVCAWEAIANLPAACKMDGSFAGVIGERAADADRADGTVGDGFDQHDDDVYVAPAPLGSSTRLFSCDEHAVCYGCARGNSSYCRAIADYYGGAGVEYDFYTYNGTKNPVSSTKWPMDSNDIITYWGAETWPSYDGTDITYIGANAAFQAINNDWDYWCSAATLAKVVAGTYNATEEKMAIARDASLASLR